MRPPLPVFSYHFPNIFTTYLKRSVKVEYKRDFRTENLHVNRVTHQKLEGRLVLQNQRFAKTNSAQLLVICLVEFT